MGESALVLFGLSIWRIARQCLVLASSASGREQYLVRLRARSSDSSHRGILRMNAMRVMLMHGTVSNNSTRADRRRVRYLPSRLYDAGRDWLYPDRRCW